MTSVRCWVPVLPSLVAWDTEWRYLIKISHSSKTLVGYSSKEYICTGGTAKELWET